MSQYRILSFDGGGLRGVFTARVLANLVVQYPDLISRADMLAGTSTGSIIAVALAQGKTPAEIVKIYQDIGPVIFQKTVFDDIEHLWGIVHSKYGTEPRSKAMHANLQDVPLEALPKDVLVATFDLGNDVPADANGVKTWRPKFYHNVKGDDTDTGVSCVEVVLKSSAAPVYFPIFQNYVDGGVVANNPAMCAVAQAMDTRNDVIQRFEDLRVLSFGTGYNPETVTSDDAAWGLTQWGMKIIDLVSEASVGLPDFQCRQILGDRYRRVDAEMRGSTPMDDPSKMPDLIAAADAVDIDPIVAWLRDNWS